jgi:pSer/pThr/pTyr-binding forkhead associated (FHA) protein
VYKQGNIVVIEDLGSTNGTYLNEELLQSARPLHPGDRVRIGDSEFTFEVD